MYRERERDKRKNGEYAVSSRVADVSTVGSTSSTLILLQYVYTHLRACCAHYTHKSTYDLVI